MADWKFVAPTNSSPQTFSFKLSGLGQCTQTGVICGFHSLRTSERPIHGFPWFFWLPPTAFAAAHIMGFG